MVLQNHSVCIGGIIQMVFGTLLGMFLGRMGARKSRGSL